MYLNLTFVSRGVANQLPAVCDGLFALVGLTYLDLSENQLTVVRFRSWQTVTLCMCVFLTCFVRSMRIESDIKIPADIGSLTSLVELRLNNNKYADVFYVYEYYHVHLCLWRRICFLRLQFAKMPQK